MCVNSEILKINVQLKPEHGFLLGLMDKQQEQPYGTLLLYKIRAARFIYICIRVERFDITHSWRIDGEIDGTDWDSKTDSFN